ncbi:MAG: mandelate racemase [Rhodospirillales bacterium CG15_BIG_FIL_POST_REV_8_21_14_020_66_15]|nr:MAG: mandelate racemase [Rhodospirillales bacterium CG15_BIG_FIL_POST_REV_8_21_14_020_66_15]
MALNSQPASGAARSFPAGEIRLRRLEAWALRVAIARPVETSFGIMRDRPAVFVRVEDDRGAFGFGEIWCNFPACGAEHRVRLAIEELAPLLADRPFVAPADAIALMWDRTRVRVLQTGEPGPYSQAIAGLDIALWDLAARQAGLPLRRFIAEDAADAVPAYASGIHIAIARDAVPEARAAGFRNFKVKVGFDTAADLAGLAVLRDTLQPGERLFSDANQAWDLAGALAFTEGARGLGLGWLEEPLRADAPAADWVRLAADGGIPLAAGENFTGAADFDAAVAAGALTYIQPDMAKWGGVTGCLPVARAILAGGRTYCPHYLGGGIGLLASAHLLAAVGGPGLLEVDANPNPLRAEIPGLAMPEGRCRLTSGSGLGVEAIPAYLMDKATLHRTWTA